MGWLDAMPLLDLNIGRQTFDCDCGAKALQLVMAYYGVDIRLGELLEKLGTDEMGTSVQKMIDVAGEMGFEVLAREGWSLEEVKVLIDDGRPFIVLLQAWAERQMTLEEWRKDYEDGYYAVVIGYTRGLLIFEDPASFRRTWLSEEEFLARWHDKSPETGEVHDRFGMVLLGREPLRRTAVKMG
jgi:ABC-type bacteriocin/lantibiotic exporter with double-glycine peptidase domain